MELRIVIFLGIVALGTMLNTALVFAAYRAFAGLTSKITTTVSDFETKREIRQLLDSMQTMGRHAVTVTESTKQGIAEFEPVLARAQDSWARSLAMVDSKLEEAAKQIDSSACKIRDAVAKPAFATMALVAGLTKVVETIQSDE
jgi:hypothetical protein